MPTLIHLAFDLMVVIGFAMLLWGVWLAWCWWISWPGISWRGISWRGISWREGGIA